MQRGADCITEGCPGKLSYCALQTGPPRSPDIVQILIHQEDKHVEAPDVKSRHVKTKKKLHEKSHKGKALHFHTLEFISLLFI